MRYKDHAGKAFGRLTAISYAGQRKGMTIWNVRCECGTEKAISISGVVSGKVQSCGCLHLERCEAGVNRVRHGDARKGAVTRLHSIWRGMHKRCKVGGKSDNNERYAGRGITVCQEWSDYTVFRTWALGNGYAENLTIDRIDNSLSYSPDNCRWASPGQQARNRRSTRFITVMGRTQTMAEWCEQYGISHGAVIARIKRGWSLDRAISQPAARITTKG